MGVCLHKWPSSGGAAPSHVKVPALAFDIVEGTVLVGRRIGELCLAAKYGMHVVKVLQQQPHGWIDYPSIRTTFAAGDRLFVVFEAASDELVAAAGNRDLVARFADFYDVGDLSKNKKATLADEARWTPKFRACVADCGLQRAGARLECDSFDCFELPYPADAPPGLIGASASRWTGSSFPEVPKEVRPELRALSMRYNFHLSPVMVCRRQGGCRLYALPALARTIINGGDVLLCLVEGGPGSHKFALDQRIWRPRLEKFFSAESLRKLDLACDLSIEVARSDSSKQAWADLQDSDDDPQKGSAGAGPVE